MIVVFCLVSSSTQAYGFIDPVDWHDWSTERAHLNVVTCPRISTSFFSKVCDRRQRSYAAADVLRSSAERTESSEALTLTPPAGLGLFSVRAYVSSGLWAVRARLTYSPHVLIVQWPLANSKALSRYK